MLHELRLWTLWNRLSFMWCKYLKHFTTDQLNWLSEQFDVCDPEGKGLISKADATEISTEWIHSNHHCSNPAPPPEVVTEVVAELFGGRTPSKPYGLSFEQLVTFVNIVEKKVLEADERAGFSEAEVLRLKAAFKVHSKDRVAMLPDGREGSRRSSLYTRDTFDVLESLGRDTSTKEAQENVIVIIKEVDVDRSGDLDLEEYLQLVRKVQLSDAVLQRQKEHDRIQESSFSDEEVEGFQQLFDFAGSSDGSFGIVEFRELFESVEISLDAAERRQLSKMVHEVLEAKKMEEHPSLTFGEFLILLRRMVDKNFAHVRELCDRIVSETQQEGERKQEALENGEQITGSGWVRRMIDKKNHTRAVIQASEMASSVAAPAKPIRRRQTTMSRESSK